MQATAPCQVRHGEVPAPAAFDPSDTRGQLGGDHLDGESWFLVTDGGTAKFTECAEHIAAKIERRVGERVRVSVSGGVLLFEREVHGKSLVGFIDVAH